MLQYCTKQIYTEGSSLTCTLVSLFLYGVCVCACYSCPAWSGSRCASWSVVAPRPNAPNWRPCARACASGRRRAGHCGTPPPPPPPPPPPRPSRTPAPPRRCARPPSRRPPRPRPPPHTSGRLARAGSSTSTCGGSTTDSRCPLPTLSDHSPHLHLTV